MNTIIVFSNDVVPGMGVPVAAPGIRAWTIASGMKAHGFNVITVVPKHIARLAAKLSGTGACRLPDSVVILTPESYGELMEKYSPATAVMINFNQVDSIPCVKGIRFVYDLFAPRYLEQLCLTGGADEETLTRMVSAKRKALSRTSAFIVNGEKKIGYLAGGWPHAVSGLRDRIFMWLILAFPIRSRGVEY